MSKILVFGHKNPDTDAIGSAIAYAYQQKQLGYDTEPVALGEPSDETQFALDQFGLDAPRVIEKLENPGDSVMLVDHNEFQQSIEGIEDAKIISVIDHHRIGNFQTADPLYYRAEPIGCTATIIYKKFKEDGIEIPQDIAGIMLSAIISDTLLFASPTCTARDQEAAEALAEIAQVDLQEYGLAMLKAGTNVDQFSAEEILEGDAKTFEMGEDVSVRIGQVNVVDINDVLKRKNELLAEMNRIAVSDGYELYVLIITNILESDSQGLVVGSHLEEVGRAFDQTVEDNEIKLSGVVSRKKQVVPQLTDVLENK